MPRIRCTQRLLKLLGKEAVRDAQEDDSEESDLDWYANLFYVEGRKCLMFVNAGTLFPVVALDVLKDDFRDPGELLRDRYRKLLRHLEADEGEIERELSQFDHLQIGKTPSGRILGSMTELSNGAKWLIDREGGLRGTPEERISGLLAATPMRGIDQVYPQNALRARIPSLHPDRRLQSETGTSPDPPKALAEYLAQPHSKELVSSYHEILGYMFYRAMSPNSIPPSRWMPLLLGGDEAYFEDEKEMRAVVKDMESEYRRVLSDVEAEAGFDVRYIPMRDNPLDEFANSSLLHQWSMGFYTAYMDHSARWSDLPDKAWTLVTGAAHRLMFFSSRDVAELYMNASREARGDLKEVAGVLRDTFWLDTRILTIVKKAAKASPGPSKPPAPAQSANDRIAAPSKVGRNAPCPCGSGKKYKHCCGR